MLGSNESWHCSIANVTLVEIAILLQREPRRAEAGLCRPFVQGQAGSQGAAGINAGLEVAGPASVFSCHSRESRWVEAEVSYLTYAGIQENKVLIPVVLGADAYVPLLRPLARRDSGAARDSSGSWSSSSVSV
jgi:hypothetical protein